VRGWAALIIAITFALQARGAPELSYSTYLGGSGMDIGYGVAVDALGHVIVCGLTQSPDFPLSSPFSTTPGGSFVTAFNPGGGGLLYSTLLGGQNGATYAYRVAVDAQGFTWVAGHSSSTDWTMSTNALQMTNGGGYDAFLLRLSPSGQLVYGTFFGGPANEDCSSMALDSAGNVYLAGTVDGAGLPTKNAVQPNFGGAPLDAWVARFDPVANAMVFATYLGGSSDDRGNGLAVDPSDNVWVVGHTFSPDFPTRSPLYGYKGGYDGFVAELHPDGGLAFSTYLGGSGFDLATGVAPLATGSVLVTGYTDSDDFPVLRASQPTRAGGRDAFLTELAPTGLVSSTYLGGTLDDYSYAVAVGASGLVYLAGSTGSADFPLLQALPTSRPPPGDGGTAFVATLSAAQTTAPRVLLFSTYLGGGGVVVTAPEANFVVNGESANGLAVDGAGAIEVVVVGQTASLGFPTAFAFQPDSGGQEDAFWVKIAAPDAGTDGGSNDAGGGDSGTVDAGSGDAGGAGQDAGGVDAGGRVPRNNRYQVGCDCAATGGQGLITALLLALVVRTLQARMAWSTRSRPRSITARPSSSCSSVMQSGGLTKKLFQRMKV
jgi:hypothetical protein